MKYVSGFNTPFAPLGLAIGWINVDYIPFASLRLWKITYQRGAKGIQKRAIYCPFSTGRFGFLTEPDPSRTLMNAIGAKPVRLGNRTYRPEIYIVIPLKLTPIVRLGNRTYRVWGQIKYYPI